MEMSLDEIMQDVTVAGAAGKMGRTISLILAKEMLATKLRVNDPAKEYRLNLLDVDVDALKDLERFIKDGAIAWASRDQGLREVKAMYAEFYGGELPARLALPNKVAEQYAQDIWELIRTDTNPESLMARGKGENRKTTNLVWEVLPENVALKAEELRNYKRICGDDTIFASNTSSIPRDLLAQASGIKDIIILHAYNPAHIQKELEMVKSPSEYVNTTSDELATRLNKKVHESKDKAGFMGNGFFLRMAMFAGEEVDRLINDGMNDYEATYRVNEMTARMIDPMSEFELDGFVGIDICRNILGIMDDNIPGEELKSDFFDRYARAGIIGGQDEKGRAKDCILKYDKKGKIIGVYSFEEGDYVLFADDKDGWYSKAKAEMDAGMPLDGISYRKLAKNKDKDTILQKYFAKIGELAQDGNVVAQMAVRYIKQQEKVREDLVTGPAAAAYKHEDVDGVLQYGFRRIIFPGQTAQWIKGGE